jgi:hypothetical protein
VSHDFLEFAANEEMLVNDVSWFRGTVRATMYLGIHIERASTSTAASSCEKGLQPRIVLERSAGIFGSMMLDNLLRPARSPRLSTMDG